MPNTYAFLAVHVIFATKRRRTSISGEALSRIPPYVGSVLAQRGCICLAAGGFHDHLHVVAGYPPRVAVADLVKYVKGSLSSWLRRDFPDMRDFCWQDGYAAYSVSPSRVKQAIRYVERQQEHHRVRSHEEEYLDFLKQGGVEYDERYVFEPGALAGRSDDLQTSSSG